MLTHSGINSIGLLIASALTAAFFAYLYNTKRQSFLRLWAVGWCFLVLHRACLTVEPWIGPSRWLWAAEDWLLAANALLLFWAAREYMRAYSWRVAIWMAAGVFAVWAAAYRLGAVSIAPEIGIAAVLLGTAWIFWKQGRKQEGHADLLMSGAFLAWSALMVAGLWPQLSGPMSGSADFAVLTTAVQMFAAALMVMVLYEGEKWRIERHVLALSNLNVTTSSFADTELQKTLSQALDRVLKVVGLPAGAIFLQRQGDSASESVVSIGLDASFCRTAQEDNLDDQIMQLVARTGGLVVFPRDLGRDGPWTALDHEEPFLRIRQLALGHGLHTVVGISLQTKEAPIGIMLLGTAESRRFTQGELRLLLSLGHQIGMALENSYLIRQTERRSEEMQLLHEIGRALSGTLDLDALFEKIFVEMRRLFDVHNFYIALSDPSGNEIHLELECSDGVRLPKRSRAREERLTEVILRTQQPVLIRENMAEETAKLGVKHRQKMGSYCGVPLLIHDRAIGVMAMHSLEERLYDKDHLEMLRVLASEASIAIENARLFREEQTKSRHLSLLNNISRDAVTTLNPDEMLAKIAEQIETCLAFDHIGIGVLDYASRDIVIQAEAGCRRGALGKKVALGEGLVGKAARSGQTITVRDFSRDDDGGPLLEGSASGMALPLLYAEQLLGVLCVETAEPKDFSAEESLLLHILADLISGALHNALTFQKAQEQAITDGLTGVKTHRFLMEALSAEWKRSARAGRIFSLVVIDLDRFKFINDFYGHLEGDLVLSRVGQILEQTCRRSDVVARYGGDEFVILMPETSIEQGHQLTERLRARISSDLTLQEKNITASFGIASFPSHASTPQELIQIADASMYVSKHQGGDEVSTAEHYAAAETKKWKRDVLDAYLAVTLKRLFSTGPEALEEIRKHIIRFAESLDSVGTEAPGSNGNGHAHPTEALAKEWQSMPAAVVDMVTSLALAIDSKDHYTQGHSKKVAGYASLIAEKLGLKKDEAETIRLGALLHDIGKVGIPEGILNKKGPLNPDEWETMKEHVRYGDQILDPLPFFRSIRDMILHHHEMLDGSGYPASLVGEQIPLGARIIAIADAYDTITSERTYKKARSTAEAIAEIQRCAGAQFDSQLVKLFVEAIQELPQQIIEAQPAAVRQAVS